MKIKTFTAKSYKDALEMVKREFGPDALIMETKEINEGETLVKVTAAIDFQDGGMALNKSSLTFKDYLDDFVFEGRDFDKFDGRLFEEIREIKELLLELKKEKDFKKRETFDYLRSRGIRDEFIEELICNDEKYDNLFEKLCLEIKAGYRLTNGKTLMLIGPTGAGKTTTILKLSAFAIKIGKRVGIINLDSLRLGAFEQMKVFCNLLGIPFTSVANLDNFFKVYDDFAKDKDIVFVDTTGRNPKDKRHIMELRKIRERGIELEVHLTVSLSMEDEIFIRTKENYEYIGVDYLIFTKLDEALRYGGIYNVIKTYNKPVSYLTNGQRIPYDIQAVNPEKITYLILAKEVVQ